MSSDDRPDDGLLVTEQPRVFGPPPSRVAELIDEGLRRAKRIDCFDFVPSNYFMFYAALAAHRPGRFCEWGSGIGIATGIAHLLGFEASGIEYSAELAAASRDLLRDFGIPAEILQGDYFEIERAADVYYTYCWPAQIRRLEQHFVKVAPNHAKLLICNGADDIQCKEKAEGGRWKVDESG